MHARAIAVSLKTIHSCNNTPTRGPTRGSETHRLGTNNRNRNPMRPFRDKTRKRKVTRISHYAFIAQSSQNEPPDFLSLCEQQWLLSTGLSPVSKQSLIYTTIKIQRLVLMAISPRPQLFCLIIRSLSSLALRTQQAALAKCLRNICRWIAAHLSSEVGIA